MIRNYTNGAWRESASIDHLPVINPATAEELDRVPLSDRTDVDAAVEAAANAFSDWRRTPATERVQFLFKLKSSLEAHLDEISRTITMEYGKTLGEARGEMRRAIENVEVACGAPALVQGYNSEDIAASG